MSDQQTSDVEALAIFDDVHEVHDEPAGFIGMQLVAAVLSCSVILGIVVVVVVIVILALTLLWPYLPTVVAGGLAVLVNPQR